MRAAKLIITILLALQLVATNGLCGSVCCAEGSERTGHSLPAENVDAAPEVKIGEGHCPLHAARMSKSAQQEQLHTKHTLLSAASHSRRHQTRSSSSNDAHLCACDIKRAGRVFDALLQRSSEQRPTIQNLPHTSDLARMLIETSHWQISASYSSRSHSPPFSGRQLRLRI